MNMELVSRVSVPDKLFSDCSPIISTVVINLFLMQEGFVENTLSERVGRGRR